LFIKINFLAFNPLNELFNKAFPFNADRSGGSRLAGFSEAKNKNPGFWPGYLLKLFLF